MVRNIKTGLTLLILIIITFSVEARVFRSGPGDLIEFQTNGVNPRAQFLSSGEFNLLTQNEIRFNDLAGGDYVSLKSPSALAGNLDFTLPGLDGSLDDCLKTNGSGVLSFGGCSLFTASNDNRLLRSDTVGNEIQESGITVDDSDVISNVTAINLTGASLINVTEIVTPSTPAAGLARIYIDSTTKKLTSKDDAGTVVDYGAGGGTPTVLTLATGGMRIESCKFTVSGSIITASNNCDNWLGLLTWISAGHSSIVFDPVFTEEPMCFLTPVGGDNCLSINIKSASSINVLGRICSTGGAQDVSYEILCIGKI